jgi:hypothetical protein
MNAPVTIAHVRTHGVTTLLVYCRGKREGDWPCHHQGTLPVDRFRATHRTSNTKSDKILHDKGTTKTER